MKAALISGLASIGLVLTATTTAAAQTTPADKTAKGGVGYNQAIACSALFSVIGNFSEDDLVEQEELFKISARWLIIAADRRGLPDREAVIGDMEEAYYRLLNKIETADDGDVEDIFEARDMLRDGVETCEKARKAIASEFDAVKLDES